MAERPIIFSAPMVRAILAGRKSQTRRIIKPQPMRGIPELHEPLDDEPYWVVFNGDEIAFRVKVPYAVGDRLWVREAWAPVNDDGDRWVDYRATPRLPGSVKRAAGWDNALDDPEAIRWRSPIHMPRWASRLTLTVTDVRVERLQSIDLNDVFDEGIPEPLEVRLPITPAAKQLLTEMGLYPACDPFAVYQTLWETLHGPGSWDANPWVAATTFTAERRNIDNKGE